MIQFLLAFGSGVLLVIGRNEWRAGKRLSASVTWTSALISFVASLEMP